MNHGSIADFHIFIPTWFFKNNLIAILLSTLFDTWLQIWLDWITLIEFGRIELDGIGLDFFLFCFNAGSC